MKYLILPTIRMSFALCFLMTFGVFFLIMSAIMFLWNFDFSFSKEILDDFVWDSNRRSVEKGNQYWVNETLVDYIFDRKKYFIME